MPGDRPAPALAGRVGVIGGITDLAGAARAAGGIVTSAYPASTHETWVRQRCSTGHRLLEEGDLAAAEEAFLDVLDDQPDHASSLFGLGMVEWFDGQFGPAERFLKRATRAAPRFMPSRVNLATLLMQQGIMKRAEDVLRRALEVEPGHHVAHDSLAEVLLNRGRWPEAWRVYNWRLGDPRYVRDAVDPPEVPRWRGEPLAGRALLILPGLKLGLGDFLLFGRWLPLLADRVGRVVVEAPSPLHHLLRSSLAGLEVVEPGEAGDVDRWEALESLPVTTGHEAPPPCPYLRPDPADVAAWRSHLGLRPDALNVGICWEPGEPPPDFRPPGYDRGIDPSELAPLAGIEGIRWFGLQKGPFENDPLPEGMHLTRLGPHFRDFGDTAAVLSLLDLTVTVDTSVANLAGAMGLPGLVTLPEWTDWRWGLGERPTWYPSLTRYRQSRSGDWSDPIDRVAEELRRLVAERGAV